MRGTGTCRKIPRYMINQSNESHFRTKIPNVLKCDSLDWFTPLINLKNANQDLRYVVSVYIWIPLPLRMSNMLRNYEPDILVGDFFFRFFCSDFLFGLTVAYHSDEFKWRNFGGLFADKLLLPVTLACSSSHARCHHTTVPLLQHGCTTNIQSPAHLAVSNIPPVNSIEILPRHAKNVLLQPKRLRAWLQM